MSIPADSLTGRVIAVVSRRSPAFAPSPVPAARTVDSEVSWPEGIDLSSVPRGWSASKPPAPSPRGRGPLVAALTAVFLVVLLAAGGLGLTRLRNGSGGHPVAIPTQAAPPATIGPAPDPTTDATTEPTVGATDPGADAVTELERIWEQDRGDVSFHGQYAAQLASKYPGITAPLQTTADGSHRFEASDILAEFRRLRDAHSSAAHPVILLRSTDYGQRHVIGGHVLWMTFAIGDFPSATAVRDWCAAEFPDLSPTARGDQCVARRLSPPK